MARPMPLRATAAGRMTGSAQGAIQRTHKWTIMAIITRAALSMRV